MFKVELLPRNLEACKRDFLHPEPRVRLSVVRDLSRSRNEADREGRIELLIQALLDKSVEVRRQSLVALADISAGEALDYVLPLLADSDIGVRQMAVLCLGEIAEPTDEAVVGRLASLLRAGDPSIRYQALLAYSQLLPKQASPDLVAALRDEDPEVRELAVRLVDEVLVAADLPISADLKAAVLKAAGESDPRVRLVAQLLAGELEWSAPCDMVLEVIAGRFRVREPRDEQTAVELAGRLEISEAVPALRRRAYGRLGFSLDPFRWGALGSLCRLGEAKAFEKLRAALNARSVIDRTMAAQSLGVSGHPQALALLSPLQHRPEWIDDEVLAAAVEKLKSQKNAETPEADRAC